MSLQTLWSPHTPVPVAAAAAAVPSLAVRNPPVAAVGVHSKQAVAAGVAHNLGCTLGIAAGAAGTWAETVVVVGGIPHRTGCIGELVAEGHRSDADLIGSLVIC